jgi:hypothetical protein
MAHRCAGTNADGTNCQVVLTGRRGDCGRHTAASGRLPAGLVLTPHGTLVSVAASDPIVGGGVQAPPPGDLSGYVPSPHGPVGEPAAGDAGHARLVIADPDEAVRRVRAMDGVDNGDQWVPAQPDWVMVADPRRWSGHKLHVACDDADQVAEATARLHRIVADRGIGMKAAARHLVEPPANLGPHGRYHRVKAAPVRKGVTLYLPRRDDLDRDTTAVAAALDGYQCDTTLSGDNHVGGPLWHRYEFTHDPGHDVDDYRTYHRLYCRA